MKKTLEFEIRIQAPRQHVWHTMLDDAGYRAWTGAFCEGSYYEGQWREGAPMRFLSPSGDGVFAVIARCEPGVFVSIRHLGIIEGGTEDSSSEAALKWAPAHENYAFEDLPGGATLLRVSQEVGPDYEAMMADMWPRALLGLKALCEAPAASAR